MRCADLCNRLQASRKRAAADGSLAVATSTRGPRSRSLRASRRRALRQVRAGATLMAAGGRLSRAALRPLNCPQDPQNPFRDDARSDQAGPRGGAVAPVYRHEVAPNDVVASNPCCETRRRICPGRCPGVRGLCAAHGLYLRSMGKLPPRFIARSSPKCVTD